MDGESTNAQDARVEELWRTLDTAGQGHLDLRGLKKGLRKLDHPLKQADELLKDVLKAVDTDGDGRITYNEFQSFVKQTEQELYYLFKSIDHNNDGKLEKKELRQAFAHAGLAVPNSKLDRFFAEVDTNKDGVITFDEWRDFLLFLPASDPSLSEILSYFSSAMKMNPEGDVQISDETIQGLGIAKSFLNLFFGSIVAIAKPPQPPPLDPLPSTHDLDRPDMRSSRPQDLYDTLPAEADDIDSSLGAYLKLALMSCVPNPGYFVAGGLAGIISRTSTAPLDRLKVYLIAQTDVAKEAVEAAKSGNPFVAMRNAIRPLSNAMQELWRAGGMRSLYAGNGLNVVKVMPESAIKFGSYEASKRMFARFEGHNDPMRIHPSSKFFAGGIAGMVSQFFVYPIDTLKFRMQCETVEGGLHGNQLIIATAKKMWRANGLFAFYRGLPMGLFGIFPYAAIDLGTFEFLKRTIALRNAKKRGCHEADAQPGPMATALIGGVSGALGASLVYPLNVLRTRLQSQGTILHPRTYTGIRDVAQQTFEKEGIRGFFRGLTPNLLKVVPAVSITYVVYESSKKALKLK